MSVGLGVALDALTNAAPAGSRPLTGDDLVNFIVDVHYAIQIIDDVLTTADHAAQGMVTVATDVGAQIEEIGLNVKDITTHTYDVVLPHSMAWLYGYTESHDLVPIRVRLNAVESGIRFLMGWRGQIDSWRKNHVDPELTAWRSFKSWFDTWPTNVITIWHDWFAAPGDFATWAAPPLIGPIVSYLANPQHKVSRDNLAAIMLRAWREEPDLVWSDIQLWLLGR